MTRLLLAWLLAATAFGHDFIGVTWTGELLRLDSEGNEPHESLPGTLPLWVNSMAKTADGRLFVVADYELLEITSGDGDYEHRMTLSVPVRGLAYSDAEQVLYAVRNFSTGDVLLRIDPAANEVTRVGEMNGFGFQSLAFGPDGKLYAWDFWEGLREIDTATGAGMDHWPAGGGNIDCQWMTFRANGEMIVGRREVYSVSLVTGAPTWIHEFPDFPDLRGVEERPGLEQEIGADYCPATINSTGQAGELEVRGLARSGGWYLSLHARDLPPNRFGWFLAGQGQVVSPLPGAQGVLCVSDGAFGWGGRFVQSTGASGSMTLEVDTLEFNGTPVLAGDTWNFQAWYRDENPGPTSNTTQAVSVDFE